MHELSLLVVFVMFLLCVNIYEKLTTQWAALAVPVHDVLE